MSVTGPEAFPFMSRAVVLWKRSVKSVPVGPMGLFIIKVRSVTGTFCVAVDGPALLAVRSDRLLQVTVLTLVALHAGGPSAVGFVCPCTHQSYVLPGIVVKVAEALLR